MKVLSLWSSPSWNYNYLLEIAITHTLRVTYYTRRYYFHGKESGKESRLSKVFPAEVTIFHTKQIIRELKEIASIFFIKIKYCSVVKFPAFRMFFFLRQKSSIINKNSENDQKDRNIFLKNFLIYKIFL